MRTLLIIACALPLFTVNAAAAGEGPIHITTITDKSAPASAEMMQAFRQKIATYPGLFKLVTIDDASLGVIFLAECRDRKSPHDLYTCFYVLQYVCPTNKTLMGGAVNSAKSAEEIADGFVASIAEDIVEQMRHAVRTNAIESLESCFRLTQSSCEVPQVLVPELKAHVLNLSQYLQKGILKK